MKRMLKKRPEQKLIDSATLSDNDTLSAQCVFVLVVIVIHVTLQRSYKPATTSVPWSTFVQLQALASSVVKTAQYRDSCDQMFENETSAKIIFWKDWSRALNPCLNGVILFFQVEFSVDRVERKDERHTTTSA